MKKMLVTLNDPPYEMLLQMARRRGLTVQMMLRAVVIPQWLEDRMGQTTYTESTPQLLPPEGSGSQAQS